jgi:hypothetical protein
VATAWHGVAQIIGRTTIAALVGWAVLVVGSSVRKAAAVTVTYVAVDPNGPPLALGKGAGDLDRDGDSDLVVASTSGGVFWYTNPSKAKRVVDLETKAGGVLAVADLDGDGDGDIIVPVPRESGPGGTVPVGVVWFANNGSGTRWVKRTLISGRRAHDIEVADVDGDGRADVALRNEYPTGNTVAFLRQLSPSSWAQKIIDLPEPGTGLALADLDRDGRPDLVIGKYWYRNTSAAGRISFSGRFTYNAVAEQEAQVAAGDINGDGRLDLFVTAAHPTIPGGGKNAWYAQPADPKGTWAEHVLERSERRIFHTALVADLDGDDDNDLATAMSAGPGAKVQVYFNDGNGGFGAPFVVANAKSHAMHVVTWNSKPSLFGADFTDKQVTPIDLWQLSP